MKKYVWEVFQWDRDEPRDINIAYFSKPESAVDFVEKKYPNYVLVDDIVNADNQLSFQKYKHNNVETFYVCIVIHELND